MSGDFFFPWDSSCWLPFYDNSKTAQSRHGTEKKANHLKLTTELTGNRFKTFLKTLNTYLLGLVFIKLTESVGAGGSAVCAACPACRVCVGLGTASCQHSSALGLKRKSFSVNV